MAWIVHESAVLQRGLALVLAPTLGCAGVGDFLPSVERPATGACNAPPWPA
jgi:hypothetical protein